MIQKLWPQISLVGDLFNKLFFFLIFPRNLQSIITSFIYLYLFIILDPLSSVNKTECTWRVSKRRKRELVQKKFKSKVNKDDRDSVNPSKCQVTQARNPLQTQYVIHGQVLEAVDHARYLGLEIGHDLNWNQHIQNVTTKANRTLGFIQRNIQTKHEGMLQHNSKVLARVCLPCMEPLYPDQHE